MGAIEHLTISIPSDVADSVRDRVAAGEFADLNEAVLEALLGWVDHHAKLEDLDAEDAFRAKVRAAYDAWRANPTDVLPLGEAIERAKHEGRVAE